MSKCIDSGKEGAKKCLKYRDDGYEACKEYRDDGYSSCDRWDANCCDWWPCSWACKIVSWICAAWIWISNIVCVFAVWISNLVCVLWVVISTAICVAVDAVVTVLGAIVDTLESIFGWILSAIAFVIEFILSIPIVGRLIGWILAAFQTWFWFVTGIIDTIAGLIGIRAADLTATGSDYNKIAILNCFFGTWRKVVGYGAPITVFIIRSLEEGVGRSLGPLTDYIVIGGSQMPRPDVTDVAHEIGHACNLWHAGDSTNLMNGNSPRGTGLSWWQLVLARSSRHVSYF